MDKLSIQMVESNTIAEWIFEYWTKLCLLFRSPFTYPTSIWIADIQIPHVQKSTIQIGL